MNWFGKLILVFKDRQLRKKILFVLFIFFVFRLAANIPIPGIDTENLQRFFGENQVFGLLNLFTGGALSKLSIVMLGLGPYITATIILQLLTMIFPAFEKLYKEEGEQGKQKFNQYARMATVPLAILQGYSMLILFQHQGIISSISPLLLLTSISTITAGAVFLMWLGELISEKGIGNGVSLLIFAGIVARTPMEVQNIAANWDPSNLPLYILFLAVALVIVAGVVMVNEGRRNIPVSYAKRVRGTKVYGGVSTYLPLRVNQAGVIPIIFAMSILLFPQMILNFLSNIDNAMLQSVSNFILRILENGWFYSILYFILVFLFTYFYTAVTFDPEAISTNLKKSGAFIPGIRPGKSTSEYLGKVLTRITLVGALFLGVIAVLPLIMKSLTGISSLAIGGTALLIVVSVVLDLIKKIDAQISMREY